MENFIDRIISTINFDPIPFEKYRKKKGFRTKKDVKNYLMQGSVNAGNTNQKVISELRRSRTRQ